MDTQRALAVVLLAVLVVAAAPAAWALTTTVPVTGTIPVTTDQTPTVHLATGSGGADLDIQSFFDGDELNITTAQGDITVSGDPGAAGEIALGNIEGTQTQVTQIEAGASWLELDPGDKQRVDVRGDADALSFQAIAVDDGATDLQVSGTQGGSAELRLHGLAAGEDYALYDPSRGEVLGSGTADGSGVFETAVDLPDGSQSLEVRTQDDFADPSVSNPQPTGQVADTPDQLSVEASAGAWPATVNISLNGTQVKSTEITSNQTVTANVTVEDLGTYDWSANITDGLGQTDSLDAQFATPTELTFREEHTPTEVIDDVALTIRFFTTEGDIAIERQTSDGTLDLDGLPGTSFVVFAESDQHYDRTIFVDSIFEQETMFLLNSTAVPRDNDSALRSRFVFEDLTGDFPKAQTTVQVQRAVDVNGNGTSQYRTIAGDFWGASSDYEVILEQGTRYRLRVVNQESGTERIVGSHIPTSELTHTIRVAGVVEEIEGGSGVLSLATLNASSGTATVAFNDPQNATDELHVRIEQQGGDAVLLNETIGGPLGTVERSVAVNDSQAQQRWVAIVEANGGDRHRQAIPIGSGQVALPVAVPGWLLSLLLVMSVTFVGALYGPRTAVMGAWAMVFVAAGAALFGWAFGGVSVVVAALVATGVTLTGRFLPG